MMKQLSIYDLAESPFALIGKKWAMITTRAQGKTNTMTASWGGMGILWNKPVVYLFVRPQRYTRELLDLSERLSVCFLPEQYRKQLQYCGSHSGREEDKLAICGFTAAELDGAPVLEQADLALTCKKLYRQRLSPECFFDPSLDQLNYPNQDYHFLYVAEVLGAYQKE